MTRTFCMVVALFTMAGAVHAQGASKQRETEEQKQLQKFRDLVRELRELPGKSPAGMVRPTDQKNIFGLVAKINHPQAARFLIQCIDDPDFAHLREELLRMLTTAAGADEALVSGVMRAHMRTDDPARRIARDYLLNLAKRRRRDEWLSGLFDGGTIEDRFLALQAMGEIGSPATLDCANALHRDRSWKPDPTGLISCGTIALSLREVEGEPAARLLLVLASDPRFGPTDARKMREATRLWRKSDLRTYVDINKLADSSPRTRQDTATFLGTVGIEAARAPLVRVAFNAQEAPEVRAAAATALGGLRIAKEDLAATLETLLSDPSPLVRRGAQDGLGRLKVKVAAKALVSMLGGRFDAEIRAALSRATERPADTDWNKWLLDAFEEPKPPPRR